MKCRRIMDCLEELSPISLAESWDNVGLLCGREENEITIVMIAVDATSQVVEEAVVSGAQLLITHHPLIFSPLKYLRGNDFVGRRLLTMAEQGINYYAMHTNFDVMGMADAVADELKLADRRVLLVTYEDDISKEGIGRIGSLPTPMNLLECAEYVKEKCGVSQIRVFGEPTEPVVMVAVCPGAGKSAIEDAIRLGADVLITGDIDHHSGLDAVERGLNVIDAGHYGLEKIFVSYMKDYLNRKFPELTVHTATEKNPFWTL